MRFADVATLLCLACVCGPTAAQAQDSRSSQLRLRAELGAEYDDNVHRAEQIRGAQPADIVSSPVSRALVGAAADGRLGDRQSVSTSVLFAGKIFTKHDARMENVAVVESAGAYRATLGDHTHLGIGVGYYEAIQAGTPAERELFGQARDFRSFVPTLRLGRRLGATNAIEGNVGYRLFDYKPNRSFDFRAPVFGFDYRFQRETSDGAADWDLTIGTSVELRRFAGTRWIATPVGCATATCVPGFDPAGTIHQDQFSSTHIEVVRTGQLLLGGGYSLNWNRSNSFSETVFRHVATVHVASALPFDLYLATRAEFVYARYPDHVVLSTGPSGSAYTSIDDENRSQFRAELSRGLPGNLMLIGRYVLYWNALGTSTVDYRRQTITLSVALLR